MSRKLYKVLLGILLFILLVPSHTSAHPGRTDANGGHTCRTNCEKWGLEYGEYHYHNGGGTSTSNSGGGTTSNRVKATPAPAQAPKVDQQKLEEQRKQEEIARKKAEEAEKKRQKAIKENELGEKEGAVKAKEDFVEGEENDPDKHLKGKSSHYAKGFKKSYSAIWMDREEQKKYHQKGYEQGLEKEKISYEEIPKKRQAKFKEGFKEGNGERVKKIIKEQYELGEKHGLKKKKIKPQNTDREEYVASYKEGYNAGIKVTITKEGKKSAKTHYHVKVPNQYNDDKNYSKWYVKGYESNKKAAEVRKAGFKKGQKFFSTSWVPKKYKGYKELYKEAYKEGKKSR